MKNYNVPIIAALALLILAAHFTLGRLFTNEAKTIIPDQSIGIVTNHNTAVRIEPYYYSARIMQVRKGFSMPILERSSEKQSIDRHRDYWYKVKINDRVSGWVFGSYLKIITTRNKNSLNAILSDFAEQEHENIKKMLAGKWWSVTDSGTFTNHCIEFYQDGSYRSYTRSAENKIEAAYTIDFNRNEIIFLKGTSFGENLDFAIEGSTLVLKRKSGNGDIRFKIIQENAEKYAKPEGN